jgi:hypothetical protein
MPLADLATEDEAVEAARNALTQGGRIEVLNGEGFLMIVHTVTPAAQDLPWYLRFRGWAWSLGLLIACQGLARLLLDDDRRAGLVIVLIGVTAMALSALATRRTRLRAEQDQVLQRSPRSSGDQP